MKTKLADPDWLDEGVPRPLDEAPLWDHLALEYCDIDPFRPDDPYHRQSTYRMRTQA